MTNWSDIDAYQKRARQAGRCVQCVYPWYDGLCECVSPPSESEKFEIDAIAKIAYELLDAGVHPLPGSSG